MSNSTRCDFTASASINGSQSVLVTELKGQWHKALFTAATVQLAERYSIYPGAAHQGVYLVLWFGGEEVIAGKKGSPISSPTELRNAIVAKMPESLQGRIDVYVLDVHRPKPKSKSKRNKAKAGKAKAGKAKAGKAVKPAKPSRAK